MAIYTCPLYESGESKNALGRTPLHVAARERSRGVHVFEFLLRHGANGDNRDNFGDTSMDFYRLAKETAKASGKRTPEPKSTKVPDEEKTEPIPRVKPAWELWLQPRSADKKETSDEQVGLDVDSEDEWETTDEGSDGESH